MEKQNSYSYMEEMITRYIYQVTKHLPAKSSKDIEDELNTLIYDMLDNKTKGNEPSKEDINSVLKELGNPYDLADKYRDKTRYLISPVFFPAYITTLKIVIGATLLGLTIAAILGIVIDTEIVWYQYLSSWIADSIGGLFSAFAWVTIIFAIFEWRGVKINEIMPEWEPSSLPPVQTKEINIPIWEPIGNIIFNIFALSILVSAPQLIGIYRITNSTVKVIPVFDHEVLRTVLPLFIICIGLAIVKSIWEIIERRITLRYAVTTVIINTITIGLLIVIFTKFPIWNPNFMEENYAIFHVSPSDTIVALWKQLTSNLIIFLAIVYLIDSATVLYKAFKYDRKLFLSK